MSKRIDKLTRYLRTSRCPNPDFNAGDSSFMHVSLTTEVHGYDFNGKRFAFQYGKTGKILPEGILVLRFQSELELSHIIYEEYETEEAYEEAINKYSMIRELIHDRKIF